ncbi:zinc ribbon domain-containing protein [bacterium]|nr:zinc ribbon domain-containing protein [bacterium]
MPWYDYQCEKCGAVFEVQRAMDAVPKVRCKLCGSRRTVRIFTPAGVHFKGSGFYVTDRKGSGAAARSEQQETSVDGKAKPAKKPEKKVGSGSKSESKGSSSGKPAPTAD